MKIRISVLLAIAAFATAPDQSRAADLTTLVSFNGSNGAGPSAGLIADANGNLFGTTSVGGAAGIFCGGCGTVFEIAKTAAGGYASTPTTLVSFCSQSFDCEDGDEPRAGLIIDAAGNLFGTTVSGGGPIQNTGVQGTVFEIAKTAGGYASTPGILAIFELFFHGWLPYGGVIADANGNLFGTTSQGVGSLGNGTVFEITRTGPTTLTTLVEFNGTNGANPRAGLIADANGNLFGTTSGGGASGDGTVFEIAKTASGYANTPTTLVSFNGSNGAEPVSSLIADSNGNLFGTTSVGGATGNGTVFEVAKTASGYASTPTTLVSFNGSNGANPMAGLLADANGKLFGTTFAGGANGAGTVFDLQTFAGLPGQPTCIGNSFSALTQKYGGLNAAAAALGYSSISALQRAIMAYCDGSDQVASSLH
jgi:uncharacterized repeat protein (TIGR03803 family)